MDDGEEKRMEDGKEKRMEDGEAKGMEDESRLGGYKSWGGRGCARQCNDGGRRCSVSDLSVKDLGKSAGDEVHVGTGLTAGTSVRVRHTVVRHDGWVHVLDIGADVRHTSVRHTRRVHVAGVQFLLFSRVRSADLVTSVVWARASSTSAGVVFGGVHAWRKLSAAQWGEVSGRRSELGTRPADTGDGEVWLR